MKDGGQQSVDAALLLWGETQDVHGVQQTPEVVPVILPLYSTRSLSGVQFGSWISSPTSPGEGEYPSNTPSSLYMDHFDRFWTVPCGKTLSAAQTSSPPCPSPRAFLAQCPELGP
ncbi:hypothetical protein EYF80_013896 [Liparis tanakae]|uniref:Uncharacterized protein n=1 Tax=Liparis tanakae TaxID=230148 RepID=A0A4Z2ID98_9TELE|nr:hypothetical protein EYF80_013896 [Liparis tanakae]